MSFRGIESGPEERLDIESSIEPPSRRRARRKRGFSQKIRLPFSERPLSIQEIEREGHIESLEDATPDEIYTPSRLLDKTDDQETDNT